MKNNNKQMNNQAIVPSKQINLNNFGIRCYRLTAKRKEGAKSLRMISIMLSLTTKSQSGNTAFKTSQIYQRRIKRFLEIEFRLKNQETRKRKNLESSHLRLKFFPRSIKSCMKLLIIHFVRNVKKHSPIIQISQ